MSNRDPAPQPRYVTIFDLGWELFHVGLIAAGCYVGWQVGGRFLALFAGGLVGRVIGIGLVLGIRSWLRSSGRDV